MKKVLIFAAVAEAATGLALLIVPSLVGQLLLGEELNGVAIPVARVAGIALVALGIACWPGPPLVGMLTYSAARRAVSRLPRFRGWVGWGLSMARGCASRSSVDPSRSRLAHHRDEIKPQPIFRSRQTLEIAECPLLAQSGHAELHCTCPLSGVKRTCLYRSANVR